MAPKRTAKYPEAHRLTSVLQAHKNAEEGVLERGERRIDVEIKAVPIPSKYLGERTYLLHEPLYRLGVTYAAGELVTVVDEIPGKTWEYVGEDDGDALDQLTPRNPEPAKVEPVVVGAAPVEPVKPNPKK